METQQSEKPDLQSLMKSYLKDEQWSSTIYLDLPVEEKRLKAGNTAMDKIGQILKDQQELRNAQQREEADGGESDESTGTWEGDVPMDQSTSEVDDQLDRARTYIHALLDCPMILGFHAVMTHPDAEKCCYCPCSKKLVLWREQHHLDIPLCTTKTSSSSNNFTPNALVAHLKQTIANDPHTAFYHQIALNYIEALYTNYWGNNVNHKGLYYVSDANYNQALAKEKKHEIETLNHVRNQLEIAQKQTLAAEERANRWEMMKSASPDLLDMKNNYDNKMKVLVQLGLAVMTEAGAELIEQKKDPLTDHEIKMLDIHHGKFIKLWKIEFVEQAPKYSPKKIVIEYYYEQENSIDKWFANASKETNDDTFLFRKFLDNASCGNFFEPWDIQFKTLSTVVSPKKQKRHSGTPSKPKEYTDDDDDGMEAIDAGGPTRNFLMQLWNQIDTISVHQDNANPIKIFQDSGEYILPVRDKKLQIKARYLYGAIGRVISYCILHKQTIAKHVLPDIYKNYLLRNISPLCREYKLSDLINDFYDMVKQKKSSVDPQENIGYLLSALCIDDDDDNDIDTSFGLRLVAGDRPLDSVFNTDDGKVCALASKERKFRIYVYMEYIFDRQFALLAMKQGIRLDGVVPCEECFSVISTEAVRKLMFDEGDYDLDFVLQKMAAKYDDEETLSEIQKNVFRISSGERLGIFVEMLRDKCNSASNGNFLHDFVWYVTGSNYIRRSDFEIIVEFNIDESNDDGSLPVVHTCENTIKFPGLAYNGSREELERKFDAAMAYAKLCAFDMA